MSISASERAELAALEREVRRRTWLVDPSTWIEERLGEFTWSLQKRIARSVAANKRTAVPSCYASGKSWLAARLACWWIDTHPPGSAFVVTTATTGAQVRAILWREMGRAHAAGHLRGRMNQLDWWLPVPKPGGGSREEIVAYGRKPADLNKAAFQGIHATYVLVIVDEAAGIPKSLIDAAEGLIVNDASRMLTIGNPEDGASEFAEICKPGSGHTVIKVDAFSTPNFTGEPIPREVAMQLISVSWVEEKRAKWGETNPLWIAKVLAEFPESSDDGLIPIGAVRAAQERDLPPGEPSELGVDVGAGGDRNVIAWRRGSHVRIIRRDRNPDTMATVGNVTAALRDTRAATAKIDEIGVGRGAVDRARELRLPVVGVNVGRDPADKKAFINMRAEEYWALRERFQAGDIDIDPDDEDLAAQLVALRYRRTSNGLIQIESKDEMKRRGVPSPDEADAVMLAFALGGRHVGGAWGRDKRATSPAAAAASKSTITWGRR